MPASWWSSVQPYYGSLLVSEGLNQSKGKGKKRSTRAINKFCIVSYGEERDRKSDGEMRWEKGTRPGTTGC